MILFLYGEDSYRSRQKLNELKNKFNNEVDKLGNSLQVLEGEKITVDKINEAISAGSLFASKRMVVIENIFSNKSKTILDDLSNYVKKHRDNENIIIFWDETDGKGIGRTKLFRTLKGLKFVQDFKYLSNTECINWVKDEAEKRGAKISQTVAYNLTSLFNNDLWRLSNELDKLICYCKSKAQDLGITDTTIEITKGDLDILVTGSVEGNIFALTDAISTKNKNQAMNLLENELAAGVADVYLLTMVIRQFKIMLQVRQALDLGHSSKKIIGDLKLHPFVVQKSSNQVKNFSIDVLKNIFNKLVEIDHKIKTGKSEIKCELSLMIANL